MKICTGACKKCSEKPEPECGEICREMAELQLDLLNEILLTELTEKQADLVNKGCHL